MSSAVDTAATMSRRSLYLTVLGLMLSLLISALDQTIVGTAMPRIVSDLHGFDRYAWVTTAYLLTSTAVVPVIGKLGDMYGRKRFLLVGIAFFVATSALCGLSQSMNELILFRGLQGLGGGVLAALVFTMISAIFPPAERARMQGLFSAVFGLASIVGPLLGGYLTDNLSWRWVFYVNLPVGIAALLVIGLFFSEPRRAAIRRRIDYPGAVTLVASVVPFLIALSIGGINVPWLSWQVIGLIAVAVVMAALFLFVEARSDEPIIPLRLFRNQVVAVASVGIGVLTVALFGTVLFLPLFFQGVLGTDATASGTVLIPMMLSMVVSSIVSGQIIARTGRYKPAGLLGLVVTTVGMFLLTRMHANTDYATAVRDMVIIGVGLGPGMPVFTLAAQSAVPLEEIGVVTSLTQFARSIGGTLGAAIMGSVLVNAFGPAFTAALSPEVARLVPPAVLSQLTNPSILMDPTAASTMQQTLGSMGAQGAAIGRLLGAALKTALNGSLHDVFLAGAIAAALGTVVTVFLPEIPLRGRATSKTRIPLAAEAVAVDAAGLHPAGAETDVLVGSAPVKHY